MVMIICPRCHQRKSVNGYDSDFQHECNSNNPVLDRELVKKIGDYEDEETKEIVKVPNALLQGSVNRLNFTRAGIEGNRFSTLLVTYDGSKSQSTHRTRHHFHNLDFGGPINEQGI